MVRYGQGSVCQQNQQMMDETGVKGPILALLADKNALSSFLLPHLQV